MCCVAASFSDPRLDVVQSLFNDDRSLKPLAAEKQRSDGYAWACQFG